MLVLFIQSQANKMETAWKMLVNNKNKYSLTVRHHAMPSKSQCRRYHNPNFHFRKMRRKDSPGLFVVI